MDARHQFVELGSRPIFPILVIILTILLPHVASRQQTGPVSDLSLSKQVRVLFSRLSCWEFDSTDLTAKGMKVLLHFESIAQRVRLFFYLQSYVSDEL